MARPPPQQGPASRCAVYTRKSSEEGLDQDFNSLHAQREACQAYVRSQVGEGWTLLATPYDDGGFTGGNLDRPALRKLLADIGRGMIDVVVVYKVDRLTRSLSDFAKIVDAFDVRGVSFVSVTQSFNTTTSMGRLTLNVLLSFAQFEREVTGERIRDKISQSKKKGLWMGGNLPLGYEAHGRTLAINPLEAEQVRYIFHRYLDLKSVHRLAAELNAAGVRSKRRTTKAGAVIGGVVLGRGALFHMLANRLYVGQIVHKGEAHTGRHPAIVDPATFEAAQAALEANRTSRSIALTPRRQSPLTGLIFDDAGEAMSPTISYGRGGRRYRYYVSSPLQKGTELPAPNQLRRLNADDIEAFVEDQLRRLLTGIKGAAAQLYAALDRVDVYQDHVVLTVAPTANSGGGHRRLQDILEQLLEGERAWLDQGGQAVKVELPVRLKFRGGRSWRVDPSGRAAAARPRMNRILLAGLKRAHKTLRALNASPLQSIAAVATGEGPDSTYLRRLCCLAFLAPDIQEAILQGRQPRGLTLQSILVTPIPASWSEQRRILGLGGRTLGQSGGQSTRALAGTDE